MEQLIRAEQIEQKIREQIEINFKVVVLKEENRIIFTDAHDKSGACLRLTPYAAAIRRNPPLPGAYRVPCMADVVRADTGLLSKEALKTESYGLLKAALQYQYQMNVPFCLLSPDADVKHERTAGFHYICDRPDIRRNSESISGEMLERAANGEQVRLTPSTHILAAIDKSDLLSLAHFVNATLCRKYGLFIIRSAAYYERLQERLNEKGGRMYSIMENGKLKGYFVECDGFIQEAVFENEFDMDRYFDISAEKKPYAMARIVNLAELLKNVAGDGKITVAIRLKDEELAQNDGLFIWYIDEKGSHMERVKEHENTEDTPEMRPEVTATIGEFTAFIFEYIKLKQNIKFDSIYLSGPAWLRERY